MGAVAVSDSSACFWDPFPPTGLPHPSLIRGFVPALIVVYCIMFRRYPWEDCSFLKENEGGVDIGERVGREGLGGGKNILQGESTFNQVMRRLYGRMYFVKYPWDNNA